MANGLTDLIPHAYKALNVVSRELVGLIPAVTRDATVDRVAVGQKLKSHVVPAQPAQNIVPGVAAPNTGSQNIGNRELEITKSRAVPFQWQGEEQQGLNNGGAGVLTIQQDQIAQAMRTLTNEVEADLAALHATFSRAYGTPGVTPFGTAGDYTDASKTLQILKDNGTPQSDLHMVINTNVGANFLGKQAGKVNEAGSNSMLRQGVLLDVHGMPIRESGQIANHTKGTAAGATSNATGYPVGSTVITLASAGTGTVVPGDVVTWAGDANQYVVALGDGDVSNGGTITLAEPGLRKALPAAATALTVLASSGRNMVFRRSALVLAARLPALPKGGDSAADRTTITDPMSGLSFELAMYQQYRQVYYEVALAWGCGNVKPEHTGLLLA